MPLKVVVFFFQLERFKWVTISNYPYIICGFFGPACEFRSLQRFTFIQKKLCLYFRHFQLCTYVFSKLPYINIPLIFLHLIAILKGFTTLQLIFSWSLQIIWYKNHLLRSFNYVYCNNDGKMFSVWNLFPVTHWSSLKGTLIWDFWAHQFWFFCSRLNIFGQLASLGLKFFQLGQ